MNPDRDGRKRVLDLIANDDSGLLETEAPKQKTQSSSTSIVERSLQEILDFASEQGHLPTKNLDWVWEYQLATRLENAKASPELKQVLAKLDKKGLRP